MKFRTYILFLLFCFSFMACGWSQNLTTDKPSEQGTLPTPRIYLNLSGFNLEAPKRFTAPALEDSTDFYIRRKDGGDVLFEGKITDHIGDFSTFNPKNYYPQEYIIEAGDLISEPFYVGAWWLQKITYQPAMDFMIQSRHYVGNVRETRSKSYGWRDDTHFAFELNTLVEQYLSNPVAYDRMPRKINYEEPDKRKAWGELKPYNHDAPDIVKLIHWGADIILTRGLKHEMFKEQLAYFLYAWPWIEKWLPDQNYQRVKEYAFNHWTKEKKDLENEYWHEETPEGSHNLIEINTEIGSTKGANPPGHTIQPNLLMYEVAQRESLEAEKYIDAAVRQAKWVIDNLDWEDPQSTKGQRMSEHITLTALVHLLREYPEKAPDGLQEKIFEWAQVVLKRSKNMWDFRKLSENQWVPTGPEPTMWNETGNIAGFPAIALAAASVIDNENITVRLEELAQSHFDNLFGRNPTGRHASYNAPVELKGVEHGWFSEHLGGIGLLENVMFVLDGSPKEEHYPYNPEIGDVGWTEGWVNFNTAYNRSLAWHAWYNSEINLDNKNNKVFIKLRAPLNFNYRSIETVQVRITTSGGDVEWVELKDAYDLALDMEGHIYLKESDRFELGNGVLEFSKGEEIKVSYGYGYMEQQDRILIEE